MMPSEAAFAIQDNAARTARYHATQFDFFVVGNVSASKEPKWRTYPRGAVEAMNLDEAVGMAIARTSISHKDHLLIRETGSNGVLLHLFAIKRRASPRYVHENHVTRRVHPLYAAPVCSIDGAALLPLPMIGGGL